MYHHLACGLVDFLKVARQLIRQYKLRIKHLPVLFQIPPSHSLPLPADVGLDLVEGKAGVNNSPDKLVADTCLSSLMKRSPLCVLLCLFIRDRAFKVTLIVSFSLLQIYLSEAKRLPGYGGYAQYHSLPHTSAFSSRVIIALHAPCSRRSALFLICLPDNSTRRSRISDLFAMPGVNSLPPMGAKTFGVGTDTPTFLPQSLAVLPISPDTPFLWPADGLNLSFQPCST